MLPLFARCVFAAEANDKRAAGGTLLAVVIGKGVIALYEASKQAKGILRGGAAFLLALLLCAGAPAEAAEVRSVFQENAARAQCDQVVDHGIMHCGTSKVTC